MIIFDFKIEKMKKIDIRSTSFWNSILIVTVIFAAFILPVLPVQLHLGVFRITYTLIYITAILSLEKRSKFILVLFASTFFMEWFSSLFQLELIQIISKSADILFFLVTVVSLIRQIATSKQVTAGVIMGSVSGYLLLGIIYSIFISLIIKNDPGSYSNISLESGIDASFSLYYSFVTIASLGYGDIVPLKPYTRSLATFIAVSGQLYIAIIVALLVGKFSSQQASK